MGVGAEFIVSIGVDNAAEAKAVLEKLANHNGTSFELDDDDEDFIQGSYDCFEVSFESEYNEYIGNKGDYPELCICHGVYYSESMLDSAAAIEKLLVIKRDLNQLYPDKQIDEYTSAATI